MDFQNEAENVQSLGGCKVDVSPGVNRLSEAGLFCLFAYNQNDEP